MRIVRRCWALRWKNKLGWVLSTRPTRLSKSGVPVRGGNSEHAGRCTKEQRGAQNYALRSRFPGHRNSFTGITWSQRCCWSRRVTRTIIWPVGIAQRQSTVVEPIQRQFQQTLTPKNPELPLWSWRPGVAGGKRPSVTNPQARMISRRPASNPCNDRTQSHTHPYHTSTSESRWSFASESARRCANEPPAALRESAVHRAARSADPRSSGRVCKCDGGGTK